VKGRLILERQEIEGRGAKVIDRLSSDLREAYPDMGGLSPCNLLFMRSFAAAYPDPKVVTQVVSQLSWGHVVRLLQRDFLFYHCRVDARGSHRIMMFIPRAWLLSAACPA